MEKYGNMEKSGNCNIMKKLTKNIVFFIVSVVANTGFRQKVVKVVKVVKPHESREA
jgi:hypothetical protein